MSKARTRITMTLLRLCAAFAMLVTASVFATPAQAGTTACTVSGTVPAGQPGAGKAYNRCFVVDSAGADQTVTAPAGVYVESRVWGAAGASGYWSNFYNGFAGFGGAGAFANGAFVTTGTTGARTLYVVVGDGGRYIASGAIPTPYGGGGTRVSPAGTAFYHDQGGGLSGIFYAATPFTGVTYGNVNAAADPIIVAAGGGGAAASNWGDSPGSGGGLTGLNGTVSGYPGPNGTCVATIYTVPTGGSQSAGGTRGSGTSVIGAGTNGSKWYGGAGSVSTSGQPGLGDSSGGGAGYYGGGGGSGSTRCDDTAGAGGSSYLSGYIVAGTGNFITAPWAIYPAAAAPNSGDLFYGGAAAKPTVSTNGVAGAQGGNGRVVMQWRVTTLQTAKVWTVGSLATDTANIPASGGGTATTGGLSTTAAITSVGIAAGGAGTTSAAVGITVGDTITLNAETFTPTASLGNYTTVLSCTADGGATTNTLSGTNGQVSNTLVIAAADYGKAIVCSYTNTRKPSVKVAKNSVGGVGAFAFTLAGVVGTTESVTTATSGTTVTSATLHLGTIGTLATITETAVAGYTTTSNCVDANSANTGNTVAIAGTGLIATIPAANMKAGAVYTCTFTNTRPAPTVTAVKNSIGGVGTFAFTLAGVTNITDSVTTATAGTAVTSATAHVGTAATAATITETANAAYTTATSCVDSSGLSPTVTTATNVASIIAANMKLGVAYVCTFTNTIKTATLTLTKTWAAGAKAADSAHITATTSAGNVGTGIVIATAAGNTATGGAVTVPTGSVIALPLEAFDSGSQANYNTTVACTGNATALANNAQPNTLTTSPADTAINCTYTNTRKTATLTLRKTWVGATVNDAVNVTATGLTTFASVAGTANETDTGTAQTVRAGDAITIAETFTTGAAANYTSALSCTGNTVAVAGNVLTVDSADTAIVCAYTNTAVPPRVTVSKTSTGGIGTFGFTLAGVTNTTDSITTATAGTAVTSATAHVGTIGTLATITEGAAPGYLTSTSCVDSNSASTGNTTAITSVTSIATIPAANMKAGAAYICSFTNSGQRAQVSIAKTSINAVGTFGFTLAGVTNTTDSVTTATSGTTVTSATLHFGVPSTAATITETPVTGYTTATSCVDTNSAVTGNTTAITSANNVASIPAANIKLGATYICTFTNTAQTASIVLQKTWLNGTNNNGTVSATTIPALSVNMVTPTGAVNSTSTNAVPSNNSTSSTPGTAVVGATLTLPAETFGTGAARFAVATYSCTDGTTIIPGIAQGGTVTVPATSVNGTLTCTLTNRSLPVVVLGKTALTHALTPTFNFTFTGVTNPTAAITFAASGPGFYPTTMYPTAEHLGTVGTAVSITEAATANWPSIPVTAVCTDLNAAISGNPATIPVTGSGTATYTIPGANMVPGANIQCVFLNEQPQVSLNKSYSGVAPDTGLITLTIKASNDGSATGDVTAPANYSTNGGGTAFAPVRAGSVVTLTETAGAGTSLSNYTTSILCKDGNNLAYATTPGAAGVWTLNAPTGFITGQSEYIRCDITNTAAAATLQTAKTWGAGSVASDTASIAATTGGTNNTAAFTAAGGTAATSGTAVNVIVGNTISFPAETFTTGLLSNYTTALSCKAGAVDISARLSGTDGQASNTLAIIAGDVGKALVCTYTNTPKSFDLSMVKSQSTTGSSALGSYVSTSIKVPVLGTVWFRLVLSNAAGSATASNVTYTDTIPTNYLNQTVVSVTAAGGATCPAVAFSSFTLNGSGVTLPAGGSCTIIVSATPNTLTSPTVGVNNTATITGTPTGGIDTNAANNSSTVTTFINPLIRVNKAIVGTIPTGDGGVFNLSVTGANATTTFPGGGTNPASNQGNGGTTGWVMIDPTNASTAFSTVTVAETAGTGSALSNYASNLVCIDGNNAAYPPAALTGYPGGPVVAGNTSNVVVAPQNPMTGLSAQVTCTYTNTAKTTLQTAKTWGAASPTTDTARIPATTGGSANTVAFTTPGNTPANSGTAVIIASGNTLTFPAETFTTGTMTNYNTALACTANGGATANTLSGTNGQASNTLVIGATDVGKAIVCTYTNTLKAPVITSTKTASATPLLSDISGQFYTVVVNVAFSTTPAPILFTDTLPTGMTLDGTPTIVSGTATMTGCPTTGATNTTGCSIAAGVAAGSFSIRVPIKFAGAAATAYPVGNTLGINTANLSGGGDAACTTAADGCDSTTPNVELANSPRILLAKWAQYAAQSNATFSFVPTGLVNSAAQSFTLFGYTVQTSAAGAQIATAGTAVTFTETVSAGWPLNPQGATCADTNAPGNGNPAGSIAATVTGNVVTIPASAIRRDAILTCTVFNDRAQVTLKKVIVGAAPDSGLFKLNIAGGNPATLAFGGSALVNPTGDVGNGGTTSAIGVDAGATLTLSEVAGTGTSLANYVSSMACIDNANVAVPVTGSAGTYTLTSPANTATGTAKTLRCTITNSALPRVTVAKTSLRATGTFNFALTGVTNLTDTVTTATSGTTVTSATLHIGALTTAASVTEAPTSSTGYSTTSSCIDSNAATTGNSTAITATGPSATIPAGNMVAGAAYVCTFTNTRLASAANSGIRIVTDNQLANGTAADVIEAYINDITGNPIGAGIVVTFGATPNVNFGAGVGVASSCTTTAASLCQINATTTVPTTYTTTSVTIGGVALSGTFTAGGNNYLPSPQPYTFMLQSLQLKKTWGVSTLAGNAITVTTTGGSLNATISSTSVAGGNTTTGSAVFVTVGNTITLPAETFTTGAQANFTSTVSCSNKTGPLNNATLPASFVVASADTDIVCTYTNAAVAPVITGRVFLDNGVGGATANNGVITGGEAGIAGVTVALTNCAGTVYNTVVTNGTGAYQLTVPAGTAVGAPLCVAETNPGTRVSTGASVGTTPLPSGTATAASGGTYTYTRTTTPDVIAFTWNGTGHNALDFGDVDNSTFATNGAKTAAPNSTVTYAHSFTAGTAGTVAFSIAGATPTPTVTGWNEKIFADPGCTGALQPGATQLYPPLAPGAPVAFGTIVCVVVQEFVPASLASGSNNDVTVQANFVYTNAAPSLSASYTLHDITTVSSSALDLKKEVRNVTQNGVFGLNNQAKSGEILEYRITYTNNGSTPISTLIINDVTPVYTSFVSGDAGTTPASLTACTKTTPANPTPAPKVVCAAVQPATGTGSLDWTFTGQLMPGGTGIVLFQVKVD